MLQELCTLEELEQQKEELKEQLDEIEDTEYVMAHDPAFNFRLVTECPIQEINAVKNLDVHSRIWADSINEGVLTLQPSGMILNCNARFAGFVNKSIDRLIGQVFQRWIVPEERALFEVALKGDPTTQMTSEFRLRSRKGLAMPVRLSFRPFKTPELEGICLVVTDLTEQKHTEQSLLFMSTHDSLTGLYNHHYFYEELARYERARSFPVSIAFIDLDEMKSINDHLGHSVGDEMLKRAAGVLQSAFRTEDIIARVGGDEFAVLLPNTDTVATRGAMERVVEKLAAHNAIMDRMPTMSFSFGIATAKKGQSLLQVLQLADQAMYEDKRKRKEMQLNSYEGCFAVTRESEDTHEEIQIGAWDLPLESNDLHAMTSKS